MCLVQHSRSGRETESIDGPLLGSLVLRKTAFESQQKKHVIGHPSKATVIVPVITPLAPAACIQLSGSPKPEKRA